MVARASVPRPARQARVASRRAARARGHGGPRHHRESQITLSDDETARHKDFEGLAAQALTALAKDDSAQAIDELALGSDLSELGRFMVTRNRSDIGAFKTSQIRNIAITQPYMHDGSMQTLWDVMDHYNKGGEANPYLDGGIEPLALSEREIDAVVAFMFTLTDRRFAAQGGKELARQRGLARKQRPFRDQALAMRKVLPFEARVLAEGGKKEP